MAVVTTNLGAVTAYADAVAGGYTGSKAEWQALMASYATVAEEAAQSATDAETAKNAAVTAKTGAETAKTDAIAAKTAAQTAQTAAETAAQDAEDAAQDAEESAASIASSASQIATNTADISDIKENLNDLLVKWNVIDVCAIADNTYDNNGTIQSNPTFYTCQNISVSEGQVYYAYSVYEHTSAAFNHKVRKVNFYNGNTYLSSLDYVDQWTIPENATKMSVVMCYIGNNYIYGRSADDYITIYPVGERYDHLGSGMGLSKDNIPDSFIEYKMVDDDAVLNLEQKWNVIKNATILESTFIKADGTQGTSSSFYTLRDIPVTVGDVWYAYSAYRKGGIRFVTFYDSTGDAIGGYEYVTSWDIPANAVTMSITFLYVNGEKSPFDYATTIRPHLNSPKYDYRETRIATINFQFDDGNVKDKNIFDLFGAYNMQCGFALISTIDVNRVPEYLMYQRNGFEILSHSTDTDGMSSASLDPSEVETKLKNSKKTLIEYGFDVRGWVTPYSAMNDAYIPLLEKYYDFGATVYKGAYDGTGTPYQTKTDATTKLFRVSLQLTTLANQKKAVDDAIANNGFLTFYGHSADLDGSDYETTANIGALLSYISSKMADLQCLVLKPSDAVDYYFHLRHSDYLDLFN